ncbi:hypothetical protein ACIA8O_13860 [Kitasatospora sp. NPDC051853]|uniref:hypothetical protein n=1 Tax=Kitasatospora sp. NPDC051853 TaxID=3364058 RepID=UPI0037895A25
MQVVKSLAVVAVSAVAALTVVIGAGTVQAAEPRPVVVTAEAEVPAVALGDDMGWQ